MALIELKDVTKKYDKSTTALRHIDLSVNSGEFVYLVGPSGAGKSSLIRLFYQEEKLTSGSMKIINSFQRKQLLKTLHMPWKLLVRNLVISRNG